VKVGRVRRDPLGYDEGVGCINTILLQIAPFEQATEFVHPTRCGAAAFAIASAVCS
jgi:hypothetical protein